MRINCLKDIRCWNRLLSVTNASHINRPAPERTVVNRCAVGVGDNRRTGDILAIGRSAPLNTITLQINRGTPMTSPMYTNSVPVFKQLLSALKAILVQADAHAAAKSIEPDAFL